MNNFKLTVDLVPKSSWFSNVRSAVSAKQWKDISSIFFKKSNYLCEICGGKGKKHPVECHEIWNYDDNLLIQKLEGMIALCPDCHMVKHIGLAQVHGKFNKAIRHFTKINNCSKKVAEEYIADSFKLWAIRSDKKWTLDLSYLSGFNIKL